MQIATPGDIGLAPDGRLIDQPPLTQQAQSRRRGTRMYASAQGGRLSGDWQTTTSSADSEIFASLPRLRDRSRALCRDVSYAKRAQMLVMNNVVGTGMGMQAQVYTVRGDLNTRVNDEIEELWECWSCADSCHTGGRLDFASFERALMAQVFEAGEVFVRKHYRKFGYSEIPYALELIEAERMADNLVPTTGGPRDGIRDIRMGVEVDEFYRPVAYYIRKRHPSELRFTMSSAIPPDLIERVPADQIIHLAVADRWPQTRGVPWMAPVITTFKDMAGYVEAEIVRARVQASTPWTIETPEDIESLGETQDDGSVEMVVEPGIAKRLNPGEKMNAPSVTSPNPTIETFLRYLLRDVGAGLGMSYASLSGDYTQTNYSSSRLALLDDRDLWRVYQEWFIKSFRQIVHCEWFQQAALAGAFTTFTTQDWALNREKYEAARFRPRGWSWVDPHEVEVNRNAVRAGFMTHQDVLAANGADLEEFIDQREKEVELTNAAGLVFDSDPAQVSNAGKAQVDNSVVNTAADQGGDAATPPGDTSAGTPARNDQTQPAARRVFSLQR